jgi:hypothetical protein
MATSVCADGFDVSLAMLNVIHERVGAAGLNPTVWVGGLQLHRVNRPYDLVVVPYKSFTTFIIVDDQLAAVEVAHALPQPSGRLLSDVCVPGLTVIASSFGEWRETSVTANDGKTLRAYTRTTVADEPHRCTAPSRSYLRTMAR